MPPRRVHIVLCSQDRRLEVYRVPSGALPAHERVICLALRLFAKVAPSLHADDGSFLRPTKGPATAMTLFRRRLICTVGQTCGLSFERVHYRPRGRMADFRLFVPRSPTPQGVARNKKTCQGVDFLLRCDSAKRTNSLALSPSPDARVSYEITFFLDKTLFFQR